MNVKDDGIHTFTVKETVHGPVLSDFWGDSEIPSNLTNYVFAPRWTANKSSQLETIRASHRGILAMEQCHITDQMAKESG